MFSNSYQLLVNNIYRCIAQQLLRLSTKLLLSVAKRNACWVLLLSCWNMICDQLMWHMRQAEFIHCVAFKMETSLGSLASCKGSCGVELSMLQNK